MRQQQLVLAQQAQLVLELVPAQGLVPAQQLAQELVQVLALAVQQVLELVPLQVLAQQQWLYGVGQRAQLFD